MLCFSHKAAVGPCNIERLINRDQTDDNHCTDSSGAQGGTGNGDLGYSGDIGGMPFFSVTMTG